MIRVAEEAGSNQEIVIGGREGESERISTGLCLILRCLPKLRWDSQQSHHSYDLGKHPSSHVTLTYIRSDSDISNAVEMPERDILIPSDKHPFCEQTCGAHGFAWTARSAQESKEGR